ncbi:hypothetical protein BDN72DRAFT_905637 [Pluteus cervinus]|uniref:Uncharacterized protein n=1 Tax=Pluteus cervinus TaxID=181527 RepID=A0ACD3A1Z6_9AGAR|nr:hypothetical protein BDN72DRAFT_905637 [Pluteus cervinus]
MAQPTITPVNVSLLPPIPTGMNLIYSNTSNTVTPQPDTAHYPIIKYGTQFTIVPATVVGSNQMALLVFTNKQTLARVLYKPGAQIIYQIGYDPSTFVIAGGTYTFWGMGMQSVTATRMQLLSGLPAVDVGSPQRSSPVLASTHGNCPSEPPMDKPGCEDDEIAQAPFGQSGVSLTIDVPSTRKL